ncbi:MAG: trypsin-like peptidase domain-containing protein [Hyalangium sp.]|uniref:trypsin-like peptidase domain-containing protein n=1 Tax=Hyalangium sp. TaxID=2028555 RepID=UPI00389A2934
MASLSLLGLVLSWGCRGCGDRAEAPSEGEGETSAREAGSSARLGDGGADAGSSLPEGFELGPADQSLLEFAGEMDVRNRYAATVMIASKDAMETPRCSGVLVAPRLVLTAGSCVCSPRKGTAAGASANAFIDASSCMPQVFVTTALTVAVLDMKLKEDSAETEFRTYRGVVHPHPGLQVTLDEREAVVSAYADLAVILLDGPVDDDISMPRLARSEAQVGESLVMVGYASEDKRGFGGVYGVRYFRKNPVTRAVTDGKGGYRQQGPYLWDGYAGGPCFREEAKGQWLVGIASRSSGGDLVFTSTAFFRDWLESELRNASKRAAPPKGAAGKE